MHQSLKLLKKNIILLLLFCVAACEYKRVDNKSFQVIDDGKGNLQSQINYINDSVMHGVAKYYYYPEPANVLKDEIEYKNGKKEGWHKHYREDGTLESRVHYKNGLADGLDYRYFEDGIKIKSENNWLNGKPFGYGKWYYKDGKLETYNVTDFFSNILYVIQFDEKGNKTKEEGVVFSPKFAFMTGSDSAMTSIAQESIKVGEEVLMKITVAQPPQTKTKIWIGVLQEKNDLKEVPLENHTATYKLFFSSPGLYTLVAIGEITDSNGGIIKKDSISTNIVIRGN